MDDLTGNEQQSIRISLCCIYYVDFLAEDSLSHEKDTYVVLYSVEKENKQKKANGKE